MAIITGDAGDNLLTGGAGNDTLDGLAGNDTLHGGAGQDSLLGGLGNDYLDGDTGADTMVGGLGNDIYVIDNALDSVIEAAGEGVDLVYSSLNYTLTAEVENLILIAGSAAALGTGNALDNEIDGNEANNTLDGQAGNDVLIGGAGQDSLLGGAGNDYLEGDTGADTMVGGLGNDTYVVDNALDSVIEVAGEGVDTVYSAIDYTLPGQVDYLTLISGSAAVIGTGNALDNDIIGNQNNNILTGQAGNDYLDGGTGADTMTGGAGNDIYVVDSLLDTVIEASGEGFDIVSSTVDYTLGANVERLILVSGSAALLGTGNALDNQITGNENNNTLSGLDGNDKIDGGAGADTILGGTGDDILDGLAGNDNMQGGDGHDVLEGGDGNDLEDGGAGDDSLWGEAGADTLTGGAGDDTYRFEVGNGIDTVIDTALLGEGNRILFGAGIILSDLTLTQDPVARTLTIQVGGSGTDKLLFTNFDPTGANGSLVVQTLQFADLSVHNLVDLLGSIPAGPTEGDDVLTGTPNNDVINALGGNDVINALGGNDLIDGGAGMDTLLGGVGDDTYVVDNAGDVVTEQVNEGTDLVQSSVTFTLGANVENLTLTGTGAINGTGNSLNNVLTGNSAANVLTGGGGVDTLLGGAGDDTYVVDNAGDVVTEQANEGTDLVQSNVTFTLGANVENLTLTGTGAINGTGNSLNNVLTGNSAANVLTGGAGDDTYVVSTGDTVVEAANAGTDLVQSDVTVTLGANVENLTLTGTGAINGTGNSLNNILTGNSAANVLTGGGGVDTLLGGAGDDTYVVDNIGDIVTEQANEGTDLVQSSVTFTLGANVENLTLTGTGAINGTGNSLNNILTGNSAANVLTGGGGVDTLLGGAGDDTYVVDNIGDIVTEQANEGTDLVQSSVSFALGANVENLTLTGTDAIDGTGNSLNNTLTGNSAANMLSGGAGADTLLGGAGDDTYVVDNIGDVVTEQASEGIDLVQSSVSFALGANVENLTLTGTGAINGTGNSLNNILTGNSAANLLTGVAGDDLYNVSTGDTVVEQANEGIDTVQSDVTWTLGANVENLTLTGTGAINGTGNSLNNVLTGNSAANVLTGGGGVDTLLGGAGDDTYVVDNAGDVVTEQANEGTDLVQSSVSFALGANVENLTLTGTDAIDGTGNSLNNVLTGNSAANVLTGGGGVDTLLGGAGDDTYVVDNAGDIVTEQANEGTDLVQSSVSFALGANVENLTLTGTDAIDGTGNSLNNTLAGNSAANVLTGGAGDDLYNVSTGDTVVEQANEGIDTVQSDVTWTLGVNLENLTLTGTAAIDGIGNSLNNILTGNSAANLLIGGAGDDLYNVSTGDTVVEQANEGIDTVQSDVTWTLGANAENLTLTGTAAIDGIGNSLNNILTGNSAANLLIGGEGDDLYNVSTGDTVVEVAAEGTDLVQSDVSWTLGTNLENLTLTGTGAIDGIGNSLNNTLTGNSGVNVLTGGAGNDTYVVGAGDTVVEAANEGTDLVQSDVSWTLGANLENLTLTGTGAIHGIGNSLNNILTGNSAANLLIGGAGDDLYNVSMGDTVVEQANEGIDTVQSDASWTLGANFENLTLTGTGAIDGTGNSLNNVLTGNSAANVLTGGAGDDLYNVSTGDTVVEQANEGIDTVQSDVTWTLGGNLENLTLTGTAAIDGIGNSLNNILTGNSAANVLTGGAGADTLLGGAGDDTYVVDNVGDVVTEQANEGLDTVQSSVSYTLGANLENLVLTGTDIIDGTGNELNNSLTGNSAANLLTGGAGADTLLGGAGDDTYVVDNVGDVVTEQANEGLDTVQSSVSFTLGANLENLVLTGTDIIDGTGNELNNSLTGNSAANVLTGGAGDDTYNVSTGDTIVEQANEGIDTVQSDVTWTLGGNLENLTLTGTGAIDGTGNSLNNSLTGNSAANVLTGGAGADTLLGGAGNDTYGVDNAGDVVTEQANEGLDTVQSSVSYTLGANLENLVLTGTDIIDGTGNSLNNVLTGNSAANVLSGGAGADTLLGEAGDDLYNVSTGDTVVEAANEGIDTVLSDVSWTLGANLENLVLTGTDIIDGTGNELNNSLTGNSAANVLTGGAGADTLLGGAGDDTYGVDNAGDLVTEQVNDGTDTVQSSVSYTLGANLENLVLTGTDAIDGTGNELNNSLTGNSAANVLTGGAGADTLLGGAGNDTYGVDNAGDVVTEQANDGTDLVQSSVSYTLGANLENLTLTGTGAIDGTGNSLNNVLTGNSAANVLSGGAGADTLLGGAGNDTYVVDNIGDVVTEQANEGIDLVQSSVSYTLGANLENLVLTGTDIIDGTGNELNNTITGTSAANVLTGGAGADTLLGGAGDDTYGVDNIGDVVTEQANEGIDLVQSSVSYTLGANLENLVLTGTDIIDGTGNELNNSLTGNSAANLLSGGAGADTLLGGAGDDTYVVDNIGDVVTEQANEGLDTVQSSVSFTLGANLENLVLTGTGAIDGTGNSLNNSLTGNSAANVLSGGAGADTLLGEAGDDTYVVGVGDTVVEQANEGIDTVLSDVSWTLGANLENLVLTGTGAIDGTGNSLNNSLTGNSGNNVLDGGTGADALAGGLGNDTYVVDNAGDVVTEQANEGLDTVQSSVSFTLGSNVENLVLTGTDIIDGTGNELNNSLTGNSAANVLTGGAGADTLLGGAGNDTYGVDNAGDVVTEQANDGTDLVQSSVSYTLGANLENLTLTGTGAIDGTGNSLSNVLTGNSAANVLTGGAGDDTYVVGAGDTVVEAANEGTDLVKSSASFTLGANVEKLTLTGTAAINGTGNSLNNTLTGNSGVNVLTGGAGNDTYVVGAGDTVVEAANEGTDLVLSSASFTLGANVENLTLTGTAASDGTGNSLNNTLTGSIGVNVLTGGAGNDTYVVGAGDTVVEAANEGTDLVLSSASFTLGANVENLTLTGTAAINGTGNSLNNTLTGNSGVNVLTGGAGNDTYVVGAGDTVVEAANEGTDLVQSSASFTLGANVENLTLTGTAANDGTGNSLNNTLTGNSGVNVLTGGAGNDTYVVGAGDTVVEAANEGTDLVLSSASFTLGANVENLTLTGTAAINGTGNSLNNTLTGNSGVNVLTGGAGNDTYVVGAGDTVVEAANEGTDLVLSSASFTLGANVEKLTLTGTAAINGTGNSLNNTLTGNSGVNVLTGGAGNDTYVVGAGDTVVEAANEGTDLVQSDGSWTLGANVENLTLTGTGAINGTGNSLNNILTGNSAVNVLTGGAGNDTYVVGAGDTVVEAANEGTDLVQSDGSWTLGANIERLTLTGTGAIDGTGNSLSNVLTGNSAANVLTGGLGNDTLAGGLGNDTYRIDRGEGQDTISENDGTVGNSDVLLYGTTINPLDLVLSRQVNDLRLAIHGSTDAVTIQNWYSAPTTAQVETIQAGNGQTLLSTQVDQLIQAMASFSQQTGLTWDQALDQQPQQVQTVLAASWQ